MKIVITKAPKKGLYFIKGEYAWFYGVNLNWFHIHINLGTVSFVSNGDSVIRVKHFKWYPIFKLDLV